MNPPISFPPGRRFRFRRSASTASDYLRAASSLDERLETVLNQLRHNIHKAVDSVEADIAVGNRDKVILGLANLFGSLFGVALATEGNPNLGEITRGQRTQVAAQVLYGYGYWGPFLLEFEEARLDCNKYDLETALAEFGFLTDMATNYGYLENYGSGGDPRAHLNDVTEPAVLQYYAVELNHAMKRALYCIVSRKGSNQQALEVNTLIDLYTQLLSERLAMTDEAMDAYSNRI